MRTNKRTKKIVHVPDLSQKFKLLFANKVPVDSIAQELSMLPEVKFAEPPISGLMTRPQHNYMMT